MIGAHTVAETERAVEARLGDLKIDFESMRAVSNIFRAANSVRNHFERTALAPQNLRWTAFVVLWVIWIWEPLETRDLAVEAGISKATLTGVLNTLEDRGWILRERAQQDRRLMNVTLTSSGRRLMRRLFPALNKQERVVAANLSNSEKKSLASLLKTVMASIP
jgi:DNA-binding MarR family transcriptional regulator